MKNKLQKLLCALAAATLLPVLLAVALPSQGMATVTTTADPVPVTTGWAVNSYTTTDGRSFFARVPTCQPATEQACIDFINQARQVILYTHPLGGAEDATSAASSLNYLAGLQPNTIFAYPVSFGGTKAWDSGVCCTTQPVDETTYGVQLVQRIDADFGVNLNRVGVMGVSNGGMLAHRLACDRPDVFRAGASFAGTYTGPCATGGVRIAQWHGGADTVVPVNGGSSTFGGRTYTFPPATAIGTRMATGTLFSLVIIPGLGHSPYPLVYVWQLQWLNSQFVG